MIWIKIKRVIRAGLMNFFRNGLVSLATVLVVSVALFVIGALIMGRAVLLYSLDQLQNKVDVSVYFKTTAPEEEILAFRDLLAKLDEVDRVDYISKEQVLANFEQRHMENSLILQSLEELGENPFGATLNIKAKQTSQYENIAAFLKRTEEGEDSIIDKTNYYQNKQAIERLNKIINASENIGLGISLVLLLISFIVSFNTIRLAIYTSREEIGVMRLVGASNRFINGPFIVEGIICGILASLITTVIYYPLALWLGPQASRFFGGFNLFDYYTANFAQILLAFFVVGTLLSSISSYVAIRRYLKV